MRKGVFELEGGENPLPDGRVRRDGGGRKSAEELDPLLVPALLALVEPDERGDPMSPLRWTTRSLRSLAGELTRQGHAASAPTVGRLLRENGFSLQANAKTLEGAQHPDRDAQFRYINDQVKDHQADGEPVVSVDTKKMEALEARRAEVVGHAERLREQIAGLSEELSGAEERLARLQIARETAEEVLAAPSSPVPDADGSGGGDGGVAVALVKAELDVTVMSPEYREIIALFATPGAAMRCKEVCRHLGLGTEPRHVEGMRSKLKRLVERGFLAEPSSGLFKVDGRKQGW